MILDDLIIRVSLTLIIIYKVLLDNYKIEMK